MPWGKEINHGFDAGNNRSLDRVLSALELLGPLLTICAGFQLCANRDVTVWVDNIAAVCIYSKGYSSSCRLSTTIVKAISAIAAGIGCTLHVRKITRCVVPQAERADALSKGDFHRFWSLRSQDHVIMDTDMAWIPTELKKWVARPREDDRLGHKILEELSAYTPVLCLNS